MDLAAGDRISITVSASINPDIDLLDRIELIQQGAVVETLKPEIGAEKLSIQFETQATHGAWFVARAVGKTSAILQPLVAISAPIYVTVDGDRTWKREAVPRIVNELATRLRKLRNQSELGFQSDFWISEAEWRKQWPRQKPLLDARIEQALKKLNALVVEAAG